MVSTKSAMHGPCDARPPITSPNAVQSVAW